MKNPDNANALIHDANRRTGPALLVIALFVNLLTVPIAVALWKTVFEEGNTEAAYAFIFPLIGVAALVWAGLKIVRLLIHGSSTFEPADGAAVVGGLLRGTVKNRRKSRPFENQVARLRCKRKVSTGSGESSSLHESTLWEGTQDLSQAVSSLRDGVWVEIKVPAYLPESDDSHADSIVLWELLIEAPARPISFLAQFIVPVSRA